MNFGYQDNCDELVPAVIPIYIDDDVVNINMCELTFRTKEFRAYSQATEGGGSTVKSTSSGGGTTATSSSGGGATPTSSSGGGATPTSSSGGGVAKSTDSGGGTVQSSDAGGDHRHLILAEVTDSGPVTPIRYQGITSGGLLEINGSGGDIYSAGSSGTHNHSVTVPSHSHSFTVPNHTHSVTVPNHTHSVTVPNHTHNITLPDHTHNIVHGIYMLLTLPTNVEVKVDGNLVNFSGTSGDRVDLIPYLGKDGQGKVTRGRHEIEVLPDSKARIEADVVLRLFIQSHLGGNY